MFYQEKIPMFPIIIPGTPIKQIFVRKTKVNENCLVRYNCINFFFNLGLMKQNVCFSSQLEQIDTGIGSVGIYFYLFFLFRYINNI